MLQRARLVRFLHQTRRNMLGMMLSVDGALLAVADLVEGGPDRILARLREWESTMKKPPGHSPPRRRRKRVPEQPDPEPKLVADETEGMMTKEAIVFLTKDPLMEKRRVHLKPMQIMTLLTSALLREAKVDRELLATAKWLWVGDECGAPQLYLILQGSEA